MNRAASDTVTLSKLPREGIVGLSVPSGRSVPLELAEQGQVWTDIELGVKDGQGGLLLGKVLGGVVLLE